MVNEHKNGINETTWILGFLKKKKTIYLVILSIILYLVSLGNYLLFHSLIELFSIVVASLIFIIAWNSKNRIKNNYLIIIGISYLFIGGIDLIHTLAYEGMGVFAAGANLPTQLWVSARYLESITFLVAPLYLGKKTIKFKKTFISYLAITSLLFLSIYLGVFPDAFIQGRGLTPFKVYSEYLISIFFASSLYLLYRKKMDLTRKYLFIYRFQLF